MSAYKYIKKFNENLDYENIAELCKKYDIENWSINKDTGLVDVDGDVDLESNLTENDKTGRIEIPFGNVSGDFVCANMKLRSLENSPRYVGGSFKCPYNFLTTLVGGPDKVVSNYIAWNNKLTNLEGLPENLDWAFLSNNKIESFKGIPKNINNLHLKNNYIFTFDNFTCDKIIRLVSNDNPIWYIHNFFSDNKDLATQIDLFNDYGILYEDDGQCFIIEDVLDMYLDEIDIDKEFFNIYIRTDIERYYKFV